MDSLDFPGDICDRCRHALDDEGVCPSCGWVRERFIGPLSPHEPDELPSLDDYR